MRWKVEVMVETLALLREQLGVFSKAVMSAEGNGGR